MSYCEAMEAAGAEILAFQEFGSYQGDWWAKVRFEGETGWVTGGYGSCTGCDAFQAEFSYAYDGKCQEHRYEYREVFPECALCETAKKDYQKRLAEFGLSYLTGGFMTHEEALKQSLELDYETWERTREGEQYEFIKNNK
jgi:hypothetical protein